VSTETFLDTVEHLAASMKDAADHVSRHVSTERDPAMHAWLHRVGVVLRDGARQINDLLVQATPELRGQIDALLVQDEVSP
jgi:hypothetical protein